MQWLENAKVIIWRLCIDTNVYKPFIMNSDWYPKSNKWFQWMNKWYLKLTFEAIYNSVYSTLLFCDKIYL